MNDDEEARLAAIEGCRAAHAHLLADLSTLTDEQAHGPSLLPGWTVGHVVTHIARNADSLTRILAASERGEIADQYPGGNDQRSADIESGAVRSAAALLADVTESCRRLDAQWDQTSEAGWAGQGRMAPGLVPVSSLPRRRWREVAIHHVDLGLGFTWRDWTPDFVARELVDALAGLPERLGGEDQAAVLAWLVGRAPQPTDLDLAHWQREYR